MSENEGWGCSEITLRWIGPRLWWITAGEPYTPTGAFRIGRLVIQVKKPKVGHLEIVKQDNELQRAFKRNEEMIIEQRDQELRRIQEREVMVAKYRVELDEMCERNNEFKKEYPL
jgi:hypothetical protein